MIKNADGDTSVATAQMRKVLECLALNKDICYANGDPRESLYIRSDESRLTDFILDMYWLYHTEAIEKDLIETGEPLEQQTM